MEWEAHYDRLGRSGRKGTSYTETATAVALGSSGAATMAHRATSSKIEIQDHTPAALHARLRPEYGYSFPPASKGFYSTQYRTCPYY